MSRNEIRHRKAVTCVWNHLEIEDNQGMGGRASQRFISDYQWICPSPSTAFNQIKDNQQQQQQHLFLSFSFFVVVEISTHKHRSTEANSNDPVDTLTSVRATPTRLRPLFLALFIALLHNHCQTSITQW